MKIAVVPIPEIDLSTGNAFTFTANAPGRVRHLKVRYAPKSRLIKKPSHLPVDLTTMLTLVIEMDPDAPVIQKRAVVILAGKVADLPGAMTFVGMVEDEAGQLLAVYEEDLGAMPDDRPAAVSGEINSEGATTP